jgi:hypothetical protein
MRNIEYTTEETTEDEDEQVQEFIISFQYQAHPHNIPLSERAGHQ